MGAYSTVSRALTVAVDTIEVRTAFSPPVVLKVADLVAEREGPPHPAVSALRPTIILRGGALGTQVVAPAGPIEPDDWKTNLLLLGSGALLAAGLAAAVTFRLGYRLGRRRAAR